MLVQRTCVSHPPSRGAILAFTCLLSLRESLEYSNTAAPSPGLRIIKSTYVAQLRGIYSRFFMAPCGSENNSSILLLQWKRWREVSENGKQERVD